MAADLVSYIYTWCVNHYFKRIILMIMCGVWCHYVCVVGVPFSIFHIWLVCVDVKHGDWKLTSHKVCLFLLPAEYHQFKYISHLYSNYTDFSLKSTLTHYIFKSQSIKVKCSISKMHIFTVFLYLSVCHWSKKYENVQASLHAVYTRLVGPHMQALSLCQYIIKIAYPKCTFKTRNLMEDNFLLTYLY